MLYSYLLTEKHFSLEPQPSQPTKEKRFAYKLYLDTLALMVELVHTVGKRNKMADNRFIAALANTDRIKATLAKRSHGELYEFKELIPELAEKIKASGIYKLYVKDNGADTLAADVKVWKELYDHIILSDSSFNATVMRYENYSPRGMERMKELMETTFGNFMTSHGGIREALIQLRESLDKSRELYFRLLLLPVAITDLRMRRIEAGKAKRIPTEEDVNPDMRLVESPLIERIKENVEIQEYAEKNGIDWYAESPRLIETLLDDVMVSEAYAEYKNTQPDAKADYAFWKKVLMEIVTTNEAFLEEMESKSVFWNDDIDIMLEFDIKTLRRFEEGMGQNAVLSMYKDHEDEVFGKELFTYVVNNKDEYRAMIAECLDNKAWDSERLAYMDVIIIMTAIAEMLNFPSIPLKVTLNEYIEMAKAYSTSKSGVFVNGLIGVIVAKLRREGKLMKTDVNLKRVDRRNTMM